jgi:putative endonuclease
MARLPHKRMATLMPIECENSKAETWFVYVLECIGGKLYTGITNDIDRRFDRHASGKGAIYTRLNPPIRVLACNAYSSKSEAAKVEYQLKQLSRSRKLEWVNRFSYTASSNVNGVTHG